MARKKKVNLEPEIEEKLNNGGLTFYIGTDPTGDSLHIGHFSSFLISKRLNISISLSCIL